MRDRLQAEVVLGLNELADAGHTVILITHDQKVADQARRVVRIHDGRVVEDSGECVPPPVLSHPLGKAGKAEAAEQAVMAGKTVTAGQSVTAGKAATAGQTVTAGQTSTAGQTRTAGQTMTGGAAGSAGSPKPASSSASSIEATVRRLRRAARTPVSWWRGPRPAAVRCTPGHVPGNGCFLKLAAPGGTASVLSGAVRVAVVAMGAVLGVPWVSVLARVVTIEAAVPVAFDVGVFLVGSFPGKDRGG